MIHLSPSATWVWVVLQVTYWDFRSMLDFFLPALFAWNYIPLREGRSFLLPLTSVSSQFHT